MCSMELPTITGATLLSTEEAGKHLSESERECGYWWWLRSPGYGINCAADIYPSGIVNYYGDLVYTSYGYVRPTLKISNLKSANLKIGDTFEINGYEFKVISSKLAWLHKQDIGFCAFNKSVGDGIDYNTSYIKRVVDNWFDIKIRPYINHKTIEEKEENTEIIYCNDCKWFTKPKKDEEYGGCFYDNINGKPKENDFCSMAEVDTEPPASYDIIYKNVVIPYIGNIIIGYNPRYKEIVSEIFELDTEFKDRLIKEMGENANE